MDVTVITDVIDKATSKRFTIPVWKQWVHDVQVDNHNTEPTDEEANSLAVQIHRLFTAIPDAVIQDAVKPNPPPSLEEGELVALSNKLNPSAPTKYGFCTYEGGHLKFTDAYVDAVGKPHKTRYTRSTFTYAPHAIEYWMHKKTDKRILGPVGDVFPRMEGWLMGRASTPVRLDAIDIDMMTKSRALEKFKPPRSQEVWPEKLDTAAVHIQIPWAKVWKIKSYFITPRDRMTWLKVMHRNLFVAKNDNRLTPAQKSCRFCDHTENILHLIRCSKIEEGFWTPLITLMEDLGLPSPTDVPSFLAVGRLTDTTVVQGCQHSRRK